MGEHEAARVLAEVARSAHQLPGKIERHPKAPVCEVEIQLLDVALLNAFL